MPVQDLSSELNKKSEEEKVEEEIISMVNEGNEQGLIEDSEAQFITNIFEFTDKESRDVMTARLNVMAIDKNSDLDEVITNVASTMISASDFVLSRRYSFTKSLK